MDIEDEIAAAYFLIKIMRKKERKKKTSKRANLENFCRKKIERPYNHLCFFTVSASGPSSRALHLLVLAGLLLKLFLSNSNIFYQCCLH